MRRNLNRWLLLRLLFLGIPFLEQFAAYVLPGRTATTRTNDRTQAFPLCQQSTPPQEGDLPNNESSLVYSPEQGPPLLPKESNDQDGLQLAMSQQQQDPFQATGERQLMTTLGGGSALMFEMVRRRMLDWSNKEEEEQLRKKVIPRWHPHSGISDANPSFRTEPPAMNNRGFANSIWRNVRKRNKPTLWRNALRTYDRMAVLETTPDGSVNQRNKIRRSNEHHEGAMLACAKLGLWQRALEIYHCVYQVEQVHRPPSTTTTTARIAAPQQSFLSPKKRKQKEVAAAKKQVKSKKKGVHVTDNMILSLVRACVRASYQRSRFKGQQHLSNELEEQEAALRRIPLDTALEVLTTLQDNHNIPVVAQHVNPLAAAYQSLGYIPRATEMLQTLLSNRTAGEEPEVYGVDVLNVYDLCAKDKGSYSLLVQGAVVTGDWGGAVGALGDMTKAGLYPNRRHCNIWSEISERQTRPRAVGSWKKKRDDYWTDSVR
jgi:hypothetical protein